MSDTTEQYSAEKLKKFKVLIEDHLKSATVELEKSKKDQKDQKERLANTNVDYNQSSKHFQQQAKVKQHISRLQRKARELKAALKRVEDKTYGVCERTGKLIREERLMARPVSRFDIVRKK